MQLTTTETDTVIFTTKKSLKVARTKGVFKGGGGFKPPHEIFRFFLKSEGKEIERKRKKRDVGGGVTS